jgi:SAM-dependent methyltransferase
MSAARRAAPYRLLAEGYDRVMSHVDYGRWARHVRRLLERYHPAARDVLELGCGTGELALRLQPLGPAPAGYRYRATDGSAAMLAVARRKAAAAGVPLRFARVDFRSVPPAPKSDAALLLYDGLNYLLREEEVAALLAGVHAALRPGGVFLFDQSTPANSLNHPDGFDDAGRTDAFAYVRTSRYDPARRLHTTTFRLLLPDGRAAEEAHLQRAYTLAEVEAVVAGSPLARVAALDGFSTRPATAETERVQWVLRRAVDQRAGA